MKATVFFCLVWSHLKGTLTTLTTHANVTQRMHSLRAKPWRNWRKTPPTNARKTNRHTQSIMEISVDKKGQSRSKTSRKNEVKMIDCRTRQTCLMRHLFPLAVFGTSQQWIKCGWHFRLRLILTLGLTSYAILWIWIHMKCFAFKYSVFLMAFKLIF